MALKIKDAVLHCPLLESRCVVEV